MSSLACFSACHCQIPPPSEADILWCRPVPSASCLVLSAHCPCRASVCLVSVCPCVHMALQDNLISVLPRKAHTLQALGSIERQGKHPKPRRTRRYIPIFLPRLPRQVYPCAIPFSDIFAVILCESYGTGTLLLIHKLPLAWGGGSLIP